MRAILAMLLAPLVALSLQVPSAVANTGDSAPLIRRVIVNSDAGELIVYGLRLRGTVDPRVKLAGQRLDAGGEALRLVVDRNDGA